MFYLSQKIEYRGADPIISLKTEISKKGRRKGKAFSQSLKFTGFQVYSNSKAQIYSHKNTLAACIMEMSKLTYVLFWGLFKSSGSCDVRSPAQACLTKALFTSNNVSEMTYLEAEKTNRTNDKIFSGRACRR